VPIAARRTFRTALTTALALAVAYGAALPLPFIAPLFALMLSAAPRPPVGFKGLVGLVLVMLLTLGVGLLLIPVLSTYPVTGVLMIGAGLYFSTYLSVARGQALVGTLLTVGLTIIPAAGIYSFPLAVAVIHALAMGVALAVACLWVVYPLFPEEPSTAAAPPRPPSASRSNWIALRVTLIVLPPFLMALANPAVYLKIILKSVMLGQQGSVIDAHHAGRELLGSTLLGGLGAIAFWVALKIEPSLWMFFLWALLFFTWLAAKLHRVAATRYPPTFWQNVGVTMLLLLGSAVQDSADGEDVYQAFAMRIALFFAVTLYAWGAIYLLERLRTRHVRLRDAALPVMGAS